LQILLSLQKLRNFKLKSLVMIKAHYGRNTWQHKGL